MAQPCGRKKKKDLATWTHSQGASSRGRWLLTLEGVCILQCTFPSILHELITWPSQANVLYTLFLPFPVIECYICLSSLIGFTLSLFLFSLPNLHPFTPKPQTPKTREHRVNPKPETPIKTINITILRRPIHHLSAKLSLTVPLINNFFSFSNGKSDHKKRWHSQYLTSPLFPIVAVANTMLFYILGAVAVTWLWLKTIITCACDFTQLWRHCLKFTS